MDDSLEVIKRIGSHIGIKWESVGFTPESFALGMKEEYEHGSRDPQTNVTNDCPVATAKIAFAHLKEDPKYYQKLKKIMKKSKAMEMFDNLARKAILKQRIFRAISND